MSESGHQHITHALQQLDEQERTLRALAQQVSEATGEDARAIWERWREHGTTAAQQDPQTRDRWRISAGRVLGKMTVLAQGEWDAIERERNRPSSADFQEQYHRTHGTWPTLREMKEAGY